MEYRKYDQLKADVKASGRKLSDLSRALEMNYDVLGSYVNGRRVMPRKVEDRIAEVLEEWGVSTQSLED